MGKGLLLLSVMFLVLLPVVSMAVTDQASPDLTAQMQALLDAAKSGATIGSYQVTSADLDKTRNDLMSDLRAYSDEQFGALDQRIQLFMVQFRQKVIMGLLGVNALVAGIIFYYLNRVNKGLSYESVAMRRQKDEKDRQSIVQHMGFIRERLQQIEAQNAQMYDTYVIPVHKFLEVQQNQIDEHQKYIDEQAQMRYANEQQYNDGWQGEDQGVGQGDNQQGADGRGNGEFNRGGSDGGFEGSEFGAGPYEAGFSVEGAEEQQRDPNQPDQ